MRFIYKADETWGITNYIVSNYGQNKVYSLTSLVVLSENKFK